MLYATDIKIMLSEGKKNLGPVQGAVWEPAQGPQLYSAVVVLRFWGPLRQEFPPISYGPCLGTQVKFHLPSGSFAMKACPWGKLWVLTLLDGLRDILNAKSVRLQGIRGMAGFSEATDGPPLQTGVLCWLMAGLEDKTGEKGSLFPGGLKWILSCDGAPLSRDQ